MPLAVAAVFMLRQQQQKNFLNPGIIVLTYQKMPQNCTKSRIMQMTAFLVVKAKRRISRKEPRTVMVAILRSLSNIFLICAVNPARKNVLISK